MVTVSNPSSFLSKDLEADRVRTMIGAGQKLKWCWWGGIFISGLSYGLVSGIDLEAREVDWP